MRKIFLILIIIILFLISSCSVETYEGTTPIYVTFYSHNEESWDQSINDFNKYNVYRNNLLERIDIINEYNATLNWQTDHSVLELMLEYETSEIMKNTNNKNILRYISEDKGIFIDPHTHKYNLADIAYLIEELGAEPSKIIGGVRMRDCGVEETLSLISWHQQIEINDNGYILGEYYDYQWKPEILSVPGMGGHYFDDMSSGIWKPGDEENFYEHSDNNPLIYIGQGEPHYTNLIGETHASGAKVVQSDGEYIFELIEKIQNGELESGKIYTTSIHIRDDTKSDAGTNTNEGLVEILNILQPYVDEGLIIYKDYESVAKIWQEEYNKEINFVDFKLFSMYETKLKDATNHCS